MPGAAWTGAAWSVLTTDCQRCLTFGHQAEVRLPVHDSPCKRLSKEGLHGIPSRTTAYLLHMAILAVEGPVGPNQHVYCAKE